MLSLSLNYHIEDSIVDFFPLLLKDRAQISIKMHGHSNVVCPSCLLLLFHMTFINII